MARAWSSRLNFTTGDFLLLFLGLNRNDNCSTVKIPFFRYFFMSFGVIRSNRLRLSSWIAFSAHSFRNGQEGQCLFDLPPKLVPPIKLVLRTNLSLAG